MDFFLSEELQTQPDLSPARNILSLHHTSAWLKQVLGSNMIPLRTKFDTETTVISHRIKEREREWERDFLPLPAFFYGVSSLSSRKFSSVDKPFRIWAPPKISPSKKALENYKPRGLFSEFYGIQVYKAQRINFNDLAGGSWIYKSLPFPQKAV